MTVIKFRMFLLYLFLSCSIGGFGQESLPFLYKYRKDALTFKKLLENAEASIDKEDYKKAKKLLKILERNASAIGDGKNLSESIFKQGLVAYLEDNVQQSLGLLNKGLTVVDKYNLSSGTRAKFLAASGRVRSTKNLPLLSDLDHAMSLCTSPLGLGSDCKVVFTILADHYADNQNYTLSIKFREYALLNTSEESNLARNLRNLSGLISEYQKKGVIDSVEVSFSRLENLVSCFAEKMNRDLESQRNYSDGLVNYGSFLCTNGNQKGLLYLHQAFELIEGKGGGKRTFLRV